MDLAMTLSLLCLMNHRQRCMGCWLPVYYSSSHTIMPTLMKACPVHLWIGSFLMEMNQMRLQECRLYVQNTKEGHRLLILYISRVLHRACTFCLCMAWVSFLRTFSTRSHLMPSTPCWISRNRHYAGSTRSQGQVRWDWWCDCDWIQSGMVRLR